MHKHHLLSQHYYKIMIQKNSFVQLSQLPRIRRKKYVLLPDTEVCGNYREVLSGLQSV